MFAPELIVRAATGLSGSATGGDQLAMKQLAALPLEPLQELSDVYCFMLRSVSVPIQQLHNVLVTLAKKISGVRCRALMPTVFRVFAALTNGTLKNWDLQVAHRDEDLIDTASPELSARKEAVRRQVDADVAYWLDKPFLQLLWDISVFSTTQRHHRLLTLLANSGSPTACWLSLCSCTAPRAR